MSLLWWNGYGQVWNGRYRVNWELRSVRRSTLYTIFSTVTGKTILRIEVF